jgi:tRNA dimethylallyltransferase
VTRGAPTVAAILGATAVGKTTVGLAVAERLGAEIISIDSMQIYRGMDAGTAKPSVSERARIPHHLIDLRPPSHELTVAEYQSLARTAIADVSARGRTPLLIGGSGLYWRAVVDDLDFPPRSEQIRAHLEADARAVGPHEMHRRLQRLDPVAAGTIAPANIRRTVRALEVIEITGRPFSEYARSWNRYASRYDLRVAGLRRSRRDLFERIEARVDAMLAAGLVDEARALAGRRLSATARQALGYKQVLEADPDEPVAEIRDEIVRATKRFARRQESWFRTDPRIVWFDASVPDLLALLVEYLGRASRERPPPNP